MFCLCFSRTMGFRKRKRKSKPFGGSLWILLATSHSAQGRECLREPRCNPSSLVWIVLEPAMSPGFLSVETRGQGGTRGTALPPRCPPAWRLRHISAPKRLDTATSCQSLFKTSTVENTAYYQAVDVHTIFFLLLLHNWVFVVIQPLLLTLQCKYHSIQNTLMISYPPCCSCLALNTHSNSSILHEARDND